MANNDSEKSGRTGLTTIKLPSQVRDLAVVVRARLFRDGYDTLPEEVWHPTQCYLCSVPLLRDLPKAVGAPTLSCGECGRSYYLFDAPHATAMVTLGPFVGVAMNALSFLQAAEMAERREILKATKRKPRLGEK